MQNTRLKKLFISLFALVFSLFVFAGDVAQKPKDGELYNPVPAIMHHISDSHEWHLWGEGDQSFTIPLPVILYTNGSLDVFMSSAFEHGKAAVKKGDRTYVLDSHGHIIEKTGLHPVDFSITKNVASMLLSLVLLLLLFGIAGAKANKNTGPPKGISSFLEPLIVFVRDDIVKPNVGHGYQKFLP